MARTTRRTSRGLAHAFGTWITLTGLGVALFALVVAIMFLVRMVLQLMNGQWLSALLDVVWSLLTIVGGAILGFIFVVFSGPTSKSQYAQIRGELLKLVRVIPMNPDELSVVLESMKDRKMEGGDEVMDARKIIDHLQDDPAMHIYASAHRLLRSERNG